MSEKSGINALKNLLLAEERSKFEQLRDMIQQVDRRMDDHMESMKLPEAEINALMDQMMEVMPEKLGPTITKTLKVQIRESRDDVIQALFPIIGQMIKKYVQQEIQVLSEKIDKQFDAMLSVDLIWIKLKAWATGVSYADLILQNSHKALIQEIFVIDNESGILMASYTRNNLFDQDMAAGMLTAIKSFVEDAFEAESQNLETINYDNYKIYIQNFNKFYIAVVLAGVLSEAFKISWTIR